MKLLKISYLYFFSQMKQQINAKINNLITIQIVQISYKKIKSIFWEVKYLNKIDREQKDKEINYQKTKIFLVKIIL